MLARPVTFIICQMRHPPPLCIWLGGGGPKKNHVPCGTSTVKQERRRPRAPLALASLSPFRYLIFRDVVVTGPPPYTTTHAAPAAEHSACRPAGGVRSIGISYIYIQITLSVKPITGIETPRPLGKIWDSHWAVTGLSQRHCPQSMHHYLSLSLGCYCTPCSVIALLGGKLHTTVTEFHL